MIHDIEFETVYNIFSGVSLIICCHGEDGTFTKAEYRNGVLYAIYDCSSDGVYHGTVCHYEGGIKLESEEYINGKVHGKYIMYDVDGLVSEIWSYVNNEISGEVIIYENGTPITYMHICTRRHHGKDVRIDLRQYDDPEEYLFELRMTYGT